MIAAHPAGLLRRSVDAGNIVPLVPHQPVAIPAPVAPETLLPLYPDPATRALSEKLEATYARKRELERGGFTAAAVTAEILELAHRPLDNPQG